MYKATNNQTGEVIEMTEAQVRAEIYETNSSSFSALAADDGKTIRDGAMNDNLEVHFFNGVYEGETWTITK